MTEVTLHLGDCLDFMRGLPDGSVDAVITDPPYGIGFRYNEHDDTPEGYGEWLWSVIELAEKKCRPGSPVFVWQAQKNIKRFVEWFPRDWRLFVSARNFTQMNLDKMPHSYEPVVVWWTEGERFVAKYGDSSGTPRDWHIADAAGGLRRNIKSGASQHPCPRQEDAMEFVVSNWVRDGGVVLDPFMGSGTTGVACMKWYRAFIGCEINASYYAIAQKRIAEAQLQYRMELG